MFGPVFRICNQYQKLFQREILFASELEYLVDTWRAFGYRSGLVEYNCFDLVSRFKWFAAFKPETKNTNQSGANLTKQSGISASGL